MHCELCQVNNATKMDVIEGHLCDDCYLICVPLLGSDLMTISPTVTVALSEYEPLPLTATP